MTQTQQTQGRIQSGDLSEAQNTGTGAGRGLVSLADMFAACGGSIVDETGNTGAGRLVGVEAMSIGDALAGRETAATPLLSICQQQLDRRIVERSAFKLRARMQGDGRTLEQAAFDSAIQDAAGAVAMWRAGVTIERRDGADMVTPAQDMEKHVARVAWRALVASLSSDSVGVTLQIVGGAEDDWLCAQMLPSESREERAARLRIERRAPQRHAALGRRMMAIEKARGRRAEAVTKVGKALAAMLDGASLDDAAQAAGFKVRGRHPAGDALLQAAKRLELIGEGFTIPRRSRR